MKTLSSSTLGLVHFDVERTQELTDIESVLSILFFGEHDLDAYEKVYRDLFTEMDDLSWEEIMEQEGDSVLDDLYDSILNRMEQEGIFERS